MRFTIDKDQFLKGLLIASHAIGAKTALPELMCFKLELNESGLDIVASNGDMSIWTLVPTAINGNEIIRNGQPGATLISAHVLTEVVRKMAGNEISFEVIDDRIAKIEDGSFSSKLNCVSADEYPDLDNEKNGVSLIMPCSALAELCDQTAFAAFDKDTRPILTAINLTAEAGVLTAIATNSARLSRKTIVVDPSVRFTTNVPSKTLVEVTRLFEGSGEVELVVAPKRILFSFGTTLVSSRVFDEDYPVNGSIVPTNFNYFLSVNATAFLNAIDRVSVLSRDHGTIVKLSMDEERVEVSSYSDQTGSAVERLSGVQYTGSRLDIAFNALFVTQAIKALGSSDVSLAFTAEMKPFVIRNPDDDSIVELITPMRTR